MTTYYFEAYRGQIFEFLAISAMAVVDYSDDFKVLLSSVNKDMLSDYEEVAKALDPLKDELAPYILKGPHFKFPSYLYWNLLRQGQDPKTFEETLAFFEEMSAESIIESLLEAMEVAEDRRGLLISQLLEESDRFSAQEKWYCYTIAQHPKEMVSKLAVVLKKVKAIYDPYYKKYSQELANFSAQLDLNALRISEHESNFLDYVDQLDDVHVMVVSKLIGSFALITEENEAKGLLVVSTSTPHYLSNVEQFNEERFSEIVKCLSDTNRYKVLVELVKSHMKNKDIAEKIGITTAGVSFHTQKLINQRLLTFNEEDKNIKYNINKTLLRQVVDKLTKDFDL